MKICKICKKLRCFLEKFTQLTKILHDRWSRRSRQISSLSRSLYFYLIIVKIFIFVILISRSLFYLIIVNVFIFVFLISRFLCFYPITIIISFFTYVYPKQLFNPLFTDHFKPLAAERAKKLDDIIGNWTRQRWVGKLQ